VLPLNATIVSAFINTAKVTVMAKEVSKALGCIVGGKLCSVIELFQLLLII
jgi:hypothetical protein